MLLYQEFPGGHLGAGWEALSVRTWPCPHLPQCPLKAPLQPAWNGDILEEGRGKEGAAAGEGHSGRSQACWILLVLFAP